MYKSLGLQIRRDGLTHEGYIQHWLEVHAPMSKNVADLRGYVANEIVLAGAALELPRSHPEFGAHLDGVAQLHFETEDGLKRMAENPAVQTWFADGPNFVGLRTGFITREFVARSPNRTGNPFKAICFVASQPADNRGDDLDAVLARHAATEPNGLVYSRLGTPTGSTNLAGFEVPAMDTAVELWGSDATSAIAAAARLTSALSGSATLVGAVITRETVIKLPPQ